MLMDKIDEENPINSLKNSYIFGEGHHHLLATAIRKSQDERSSTAKDIVD